MRHEEILGIYGFSPLKNPYKPYDNRKTGFELFDDKICDLVEKAEHSVRLCLVTPLLHSLRAKTWSPFKDALGNPNHWATKFCLKFLNTIPLKDDSEGHSLDIGILYLEECQLRNIVEKNGVPWNEYKDSINDFFQKFTEHKCTVKKCTKADIFICFALIDSKDKDKAKGVMAFFNHMDLEQTKFTNEEIAEQFQGFEFSDYQIVQYFDKLFDTMGQ